LAADDGGGIKSTMGIRISDASILPPVTRRVFIFSVFITQILVLKIFVVYLVLFNSVAEKYYS
jgi:hypothetical protein